MPLEVLVVFGGITAEAYFRRLSVTWVFVDGMGGVSVKGEIIIFGWRGWRLAAAAIVLRVAGYLPRYGSLGREWAPLTFVRCSLRISNKCRLEART